MIKIDGKKLQELLDKKIAAGIEELVADKMLELVAMQIAAQSANKNLVLGQEMPPMDTLKGPWKK
jgi:hypothetical protein